MTNYKQLQQQAMELGIKANQKAVVLQQLIAEALANNTQAEIGDDLDMEYEMMMNSASEASALELSENTLPEVKTDAYAGLTASSTLPQVKLFEFIRADNTVVVFKHKGVETTIGWSKKDFRCYSYKVGNAPKLMMIQTAINVFKHYKNGRDGDVAKIVKALTHLRNKPSIISAMENKLKAERKLEAQTQKENASVTKTRRSSAAVIDPEWLKGYQQQQGENYDARNVRGAYDEYVANASVHSAS